MIPRTGRRLELAAIVLCVLSAAALRLLFLDHDSLWFDEVMTRHAAVQGLDSPVAALSNRDHLPLLYWLTAAALRLWPEHEFILRLPSAMAGILTIPLVFALGRAFRLPRAGLWAAWLLALSPFHVHYSQEARHYALLLFFSTLSLYWLYRAMASGRAREWLFFGAAASVNLLTHYSAWLLLIAQFVLGAGWLLASRPSRRRALAVLPAVGVIALALGLLLPRATTAFGANTSAATGTTAAASLITWLRAAWLEFGFTVPAVAVALAAAAALGIVFLLRRRRWRVLAFLLVPVVVPMLLIQTLGISRFALPKYIIYALPLYLLAAGAGIAWLVAVLSARLPSRPALPHRGVVAAAVALLIALVALPPLRADYRQMVHDWRGAVDTLLQLPAADVVLTVALDTGDGFNAAGVVAPYYLDPGRRVLDGNHLSAADLERLTGQRGRVSALALNLDAPVVAPDEAWDVTHHQGSLYAIRRAGEPDDVVAQLARLYELLIPQARAPQPRCGLQLVLAEIELSRGDLARAGQVIEAAADCPGAGGRRAALTADIARAQLDGALARGDDAAADAAAATLLAVAPDDAAALARLTVVDVLALWREGKLAVNAEGVPEPVEPRQFEMPQTGERGEVLFMHPPASASFTVALPPEPAALVFRVALDPQAWEWGGDGVSFVVSAAAGDDAPRELYRRHVGKDEAGRGWHEAGVSLAEFAGQTITVTLATEAGPAGDGTADWAGWGAPRVLRRP